MCSITRLSSCKQCYYVHQKTRRVDGGNQSIQSRGLSSHGTDGLALGVGWFWTIHKAYIPKHKNQQSSNYSLQYFALLDFDLGKLVAAWPLVCVGAHIRGRRSSAQRYSPEHSRSGCTLACFAYALSSVPLQRAFSFHRGTRVGFSPAPRHPTRLSQAICTPRTPLER